MYNRSCPELKVHFVFTAENDLCDVLAVIHDLNDWKDLGLQLGLLYSKLTDIMIHLQTCSNVIRMILDLQHQLCECLISPLSTRPLFHAEACYYTSLLH